MNKRTLLIAAGVAAALAVMVYVFQPDLFTAAGRRARFLRNLERGPLVLRRSCMTMETFVDLAYWQAAQDDQQRTAQALADYCREQGSSGQMTILDGANRRKLAYWDGSTFQSF